MSRLAAIAALALIAASPALAQQQEQLQPRIRKTIETRCSAISPTNERLKKACVDRQIEAAYEFLKLSARYPEGTEEWGIVRGCLDRWVGEDGMKADFRNAVICVGIEIDHYEGLQ